VTEICDFPQAATAGVVGLADVEEPLGFGDALVVDGLGDADVTAGVAETLGVPLGEPDGEADGVPSPRPVSSQRTPTRRASRTRTTTARRNQ
jgi:hypothetical protein